MANGSRSDYSLARALWLGVGSLSLVAGVIGIVLPLLPTTPFLLLTAFCYARGSERLHRWLISHQRLGPPIEHWRRYGAISRRAKRISRGLLIACAATGSASNTPSTTRQ